MAQPSLDNRLNAAPRPWIRNSQTPPKSELRYSKPSSGNSQTLPKSELRYRKNGLVCSSLTPPPQARQRGRRISYYVQCLIYISLLACLPQSEVESIQRNSQLEKEFLWEVLLNLSGGCKGPKHMLRMPCFFLCCFFLPRVQLQ